MTVISPLAPSQLPELPVVNGVRLATHACGIRYKGRTDLLLVELAPCTVAAGVFTCSQIVSAPVDWCRGIISSGRCARALVANSGNANAFTGLPGIAAVQNIATATAAVIGCSTEEVLIASTGVIGLPLDERRIITVLSSLREQISPYAWLEAAQAIMTTDTYPKLATRLAMIGDTQVTLNGIAKGSGMIAPNMATVLCFIFTDAAISAPVLRELLSYGVDTTFNCTTVDSDTSTSDTLLLFATGKANHTPIIANTDQRLSDFRVKLNELLLELALAVVKDGEGATKFITITVRGAADTHAARAIGLSIANSPLVKTSIFGMDPNWGRIAMAIGKSGEQINRDKIKISIGGIVVAEDGCPLSHYDEALIISHMRSKSILIEVNVGVGYGTRTVWTCDLTHAYIGINSSYRT